MKTKPIKFRFLALALLSSAFASLTSCDADLELVQSIDEEFTGITSIEIESSFLDVTYQGNENAESVQLLGSLESSRKGNYSIEYRVVQNQLIIEVERHGIGTGNNRGYINLTGPESMAMDVEAGSGNIKIHRLTSENFEFSGGSGNVELSNLRADNIDLVLSSGRINAYDLEGDVQLEISSGNATISNLEGNLNAVGSSGKFTFSQIDGKVNSSLNSGNGVLSGIQEIGRLKISSGNYSVDDSFFGPNTEFEGSSGNFDIQTDSDLKDFNFDLKTSSGNLRVGESTSTGSLKIDNGSPHTVFGVVSSGNIQIKK
ncbi:DUF4097 family beta strand repeat-containing protein [Algoriphagus sp. D3-2-R+10]|uniref:DUF4097 family beta strand repeat-containing protein n=1 Tax=Algoriphagus aurantiacus TaxID=3103948 RepID=UPI002B36B282|nr:DUF4097 family beta strand repeat-containing protein [Algoriphagus sp. D3-2-R+10]MEB2775443.1 DUF4097 family beta strand repeat-containing protein [Algoriphagus sp. D3-2-R+10]